MSEVLTFASYRPDRDGLEGIYEIGATEERPEGVLHEISATFGHELTPTPDAENIGELINAVFRDKELQKNIGRAQEVLGTDDNAVAIARGWVERSGLLIPVERTYITAADIPEEAAEEYETSGRPYFKVAAMSGGVRNWMMRRIDRLEELHRTVGIGSVLLAAGHRPMSTGEGPDVEEGMVEYNYMEQVIMPRVQQLGLWAVLAPAETRNGDEVMAEGAHVLVNEQMMDFTADRLAVVSNAGAWVQNGGQIRRAVRSVIRPDFDNHGNQLFAVSDEFPLGTGTEPTATHQNPFSALGQIARNAQELVRHAI